MISIDAGDLGVQDSIICTYQLEVDQDPVSELLVEDGVEGENVLWDQVSGTGASLTWQVDDENPFEGNQAWFADNVGFQTDQILESKFDITLGPNPVLSFWHSYDTQPGFDGGVLEYSPNSGGIWFDLNNSIFQNGYNGPLQDDLNNPLSGRASFNGNSGGYVQSLVNLSFLAGQEVRFRFRFATNQGGARDGWHIDNIRVFGDFYGVTNTACIASDLGEDICSSVTTTILGDTFVATEDVEGDLKISIAPNPTTGVVYLTMNTTETDNPIISILSVDGKLLRTEELANASGTFPLDLSAYPGGMYFMQIQSGDNVITEKVMLGK